MPSNGEEGLEEGEAERPCQVRVRERDIESRRRMEPKVVLREGWKEEVERHKEGEIDSYPFALILVIGAERMDEDITESEWKTNVMQVRKVAMMTTSMKGGG